MIFLDTSALIASFTGRREQFPMIRSITNQGMPLALSAIVLYEWRRGPRTAQEIQDQEDLLPGHAAFPFTPQQAARSAQLYRSLPRARSRVMDFAIAACAMEHRAALWTLNREDFADIPGLRLFDPSL